MSADGRMFHGGVPGMSHAGRFIFARRDDAVKERSMASPSDARSHVGIQRCRRIRVEVLRPRLAPRSMRTRKVAQMSINFVAAGQVEPGPPRVPSSGPREEMRENKSLFRIGRCPVPAMVEIIL